MTAVDLARLVKPLEWGIYAGGQSLAVDRFSGLYTLDGDDWTHSSMAGWLGGGKAMAEKHHAVRVISALDADLLAELVGALRQLARLGNGDKLGNSDGNMIARALLAKLGVQP